MEMDVKTNDDWNCTEDEGVYPEALGLSDAYRDPELLPRIGDKFQVEIPPVLSKSEYLTLTESINEPLLLPGNSHEFLVGLPISLMWIKNKEENTKHEPQDIVNHLNDITNGTQVKFESLDIKMPNGIDLLEEEKDQMYCLVPGCVGGMWSDVEEASFVLGLYIFGKNFVQVNKFVETKDMGELLSFYYGRFYRSDKYKRWSGCRKIRSRRCIYGQRIFSGSTQQELLSRLFLNVSEDCQNTLTEVAKAYGEGKMTLEEHVFALKAIVGLNTLIEAVGIGTGKQDLTGMAMEHPKSNQSASNRPEIPVGKACSSLSPLEITNFLTGGYRLSKARSNDLFWEAVWPRLLARGWHSEQPRDHGFGASRHSLVFLVPGVKKFSRRKLVKGDHYFDSVTDVLTKVGSDPGLLELDVGVENGWTNEKVLDQGDFPDQQRHCYLKPRTPSRSGGTMEFTVVDTSLPNGEDTKVRELRSLPVEIMNIPSFRIDSEESDEDSSEDSSSESNLSKSMKIIVEDEESFDKNSAKPDTNALKMDSTIIESEIGTCDQMKLDKQVKARLTNRKRNKERNPSGPVAKKRRSTACERTATRCNTITDERSKLDEFGSNPDFQKNFLSDRTGSSSTEECSNSLVDENRNEKPQSRPLIDLNIPIPQDIENESFATDMITNERTDNDGNGLAEESEQPASMNCRRQSTRNRPLTTKALEALACGFLSIRPKKHSRDGFQLENSMSRPSRRARSRIRITENFNGDSAEVMDFKGDERTNTACKSDGDMLSELQV